MKRRLAASLPALLAIYLYPVAAVAQSGQAGLSYLVAAPNEGHPGDILHVTGVGFPAKEKEWITVICPSPGPGSSSPIAVSGNPSVQTVPGPTTDKHGNFISFPVAAPGGPVKAGTACTIYANVGSNMFGPDIWGKFEVFPTNQALDRCATHICGVRVRTSPLRASPGLTERISVQDPGWPGAIAAITIRYSGSSLGSRTVKLDAHGSAETRWPVTLKPTSPAHPLTVHVAVSLRLGGVAGSGNSNFLVVH